jgi:hypothetical protein
MSGESSPGSSHTGVSKHEAASLAKASEQERKRELKWIAMFQDPDNYFRRDRAKLESRILKGIPDSVRSRAWQFILDPKSLDPLPRPSVAELIARGQTRHEMINQILLDIPRTFGDVTAFTPKTRDSLRDILIAYANIDASLGYTQSMNAIAAPLVLYMDMESAFWCFRGLMRRKRYQFRKIYTAGLPKLWKIKRLWEHLLATRCSCVMKALEENGITFENYGVSWFMTAFMTQGFSETMRVRIYDRYVGFGTRAMLAFGLVIMKSLKRKLLSSELTAAINLVRTPGAQEELSDWKSVSQRWDELWLSAKDYQKLFRSVGF